MKLQDTADQTIQCRQSRKIWTKLALPSNTHYEHWT